MGELRSECAFGSLRLDVNVAMAHKCSEANTPTDTSSTNPNPVSTHLSVNNSSGSESEDGKVHVGWRESDQSVKRG